MTSNPILAGWLPSKKEIDELLGANVAAKTERPEEFALGAIRVAYPCAVNLEPDGGPIEFAGRTFEVAFAFENLEWTQNSDNQDLKLKVPATNKLEDLAQS